MDDQPRLIAEERAEYTAAQPDAERAAYVEQLREKLRGPEFRRIEGFPIGDDEAIRARGGFAGAAYLPWRAVPGDAAQRSGVSPGAHLCPLAHPTRGALRHWRRRAGAHHRRT